MNQESEWFWGNEKQKKQLLGLRDEKEVKMRLSGKGSREEKKAPASTQKKCKENVKRKKCINVACHVFIY